MGEKDSHFLLGVTGGIASGKSTVAHMLEELGAPVIDTDVLAREVVEPGKPAFRAIVDYFGRQVLQEDGALDRKKISGIVFKDIEKRRKLEGLIHPRITEVVSSRLDAILEKDPNAIIQVVVPLLIETNQQQRYHSILVVYVPEQVQIQRLVERDHITREAAANILKAQLPIDEKVAHADFVIHNDKTMEETREQVRDLWKRLKALQQEGA